MSFYIVLARGQATRIQFAVVALIVSGMLTGAGCGDADGRGPGKDAHLDRAERPRQLYAITEIASSPEEAVFSSITSLDVDSRGRIYVGDWNHGQVTILSDSAVLLRRIGKKGEGPGEFKTVDNVQVLPGDSLQVYDMQLARLTTFVPNGEEVAYVSTIISPRTLAPPSFVRHSNRGGRVLAGYRKPFSPSDDPKQDAQRSEVIRLLDAYGRLVRDSVLVLPVPKMIVSRAGGMVSVRQNPFSPRGILRLAPDDRIFYGWTDKLGIEIYSLEGQRIGGFSASHQAPAVTRRDIDEAAGSGDERIRRLLSEAAPERWPAIRDFLLDDRGRVWIALSSPSGAPVEWAVFEETGKYLGSVMLPANIQLYLVRGDRAYAVGKDEMDVPTVVVYRIDPRLT